MRYIVDVSDQTAGGGLTKFEGNAVQVAAWLAGWCGGPGWWVDVYRLDELGSDSHVLVHCGATLARGVCAAKCRHSAEYDPELGAAMASVTPPDESPPTVDRAALTRERRRLDVTSLVMRRLLIELTKELLEVQIAASVTCQVTDAAARQASCLALADKKTAFWALLQALGAYVATGLPPAGTLRIHAADLDQSAPPGVGARMAAAVRATAMRLDALLGRG